MTETREQVLELAAKYDRFQANAVEAGQSDKAVDPTFYGHSAAEFATIARALRLLAETMGREAEPAAHAYVIGGECEQIDWGVEDMLKDDEALVLLYASPPPAPDYAAGRLEGLEEAAEIAWLQSKQGATHDQIAAAIRAKKEGG